MVSGAKRTAAPGPAGGGAAARAAEQLGQYGYLLLRGVLHLRHAWRDRRRVAAQLEHVGVRSVPLVLVVGFFAGSLIAWQAAYQFRGLVSLSILGGQAARVIVMEIGPVLTALVLCGRIGASMAAEIGAMRISEQIDALRSLSIDPLRYLVMPRLLALVLMLPVLTVFADATAVLGAFVVTRVFLDMTTTVFFDSVRDFFELGDLFGGLCKALVFGVLISTVGCHFGLRTEAGAEGVGRTTIGAYVAAALGVLAADYALWTVLF